MADQFGGIPVDSQAAQTDQFGGVPVQGPPTPQAPQTPDTGLMGTIEQGAMGAYQTIRPALEQANLLTGYSQAEQGSYQNYQQTMQQLQQNMASVENSNAAYKAYADAGYLGQAAVQLVGKSIAKPALDIIGHTVSHLGHDLAYFVPSSVKEPVKQAMSRGWDAVMNTDIGKSAIWALQGGEEVWKDFKKNNPQIAKDTESLVNIGLLFAPPKVKADAPPSGAKLWASDLEAKAGAQVAKKRTDQIYDIIKNPSPGYAEAHQLTIEPGLAGKKVMQRTPMEEQMVQAVKRIPEFGKSSYTENLNILDKHIVNASKNIDEKLGKIGDTLKAPHDYTIMKVNQALDDMAANETVITGNLQNTVDKAKEWATKVITENDATPLGVLKARRQFDQWVKQQKRNALGDNSLVNALDLTMRTIRDTLNDTADSFLPNGEVKNTLHWQSMLYRAGDNVAPKALAEANTRVMRLFKNVGHVIKYKNEFVAAMATLLGMGGLGAASHIAPYFTGLLGASFLGYGTHQLVTSPGAKRGMAMLLRAADRALITSKNPAMIKQLRADRAYVKYLMTNSDSTEQK